MGIIVLSDVVLSNSVIAAGVRGKSSFSNSRIAVESGFETINIQWQDALREYELGIVPMLLSQWNALRAVHEITYGGAYGFLMEDPAEHVVTAGSVLEVTPGVYQLHQRYVDEGSGRFKDRRITRPRAGSFVLKQSGLAIPPANYTLDVETGRLTIPAAPDPELLTWSGKFYVAVNFQNDSIDWEMRRGGSVDQRLLAGPSVTVVEVRE